MAYSYIGHFWGTLGEKNFVLRGRLRGYVRGFTPLRYQRLYLCIKYCWLKRLRLNVLTVNTLIDSIRRFIKLSKISRENLFLERYLQKTVFVGAELQSRVM